MPANEKRRYVMTSDLRQYIAEYTVANFWRYPIRRRVTYASALELYFFKFSNKWGKELRCPPTKGLSSKYLNIF